MTKHTYTTACNLKNQKGNQKFEKDSKQSKLQNEDNVVSILNICIPKEDFDDWPENDESVYDSLTRK